MAARLAAHFRFVAKVMPPGHQLYKGLPGIHVSVWNPTEDEAARLRRQPAARDVAGMLASWDHAGRVVVHRTDGLDEAAVVRVLDWIDLAQAAFLDSYRATLVAAGVSELLDETLLRAMQVQQECREYAYASRYLPHWRYVPDAALPALLRRGTAETETT